MNNPARQHRGQVPARRMALRWLRPLALGLALGAAGCAQTTSPQVTESAIAGPLVLNSAPGAVEPTPVAPVATEPAAVAPAPTALQSDTKSATEPAAAAAAVEGQFPNINRPPVQPNGRLLADGTRAKIIADLEKLRDRQAAPASAGAGGNPADLVNAAETHGQAAIRQIETCSQDGALQTNPDCAPD